MKQSKVVVIALGMLLFSARAAQPVTSPAILSGTVVTAPGVAPVVPGSPSAPAPPPMPAGYVVVSTNHIDQVAATAKLAIEASQKNEESVIKILGYVGSAFAALVAVFAFFGIKEFKDIKAKAKGLAEPLEKLQSMNVSLTQVHEMSEILIRLFSLRHMNQQLGELVRKQSPDVKKTALDAIPEGRALLDLAKAHYKAVRETEKQHTAEHDESLSKQSERVLSYVAAVLAVIAMRADAFNDAVRWAEESVEHNPRQYDDRYYNLACALTRRNEGNDRVRALVILEDAFKRKAISWQEAWDDEDFQKIRDGLAKSEFKNAAVVAAGGGAQWGANLAVRRLRKKRR